MPNAPTVNLGLIVPTVGGDSGIWGDELNTNLGIIDTLAVFPFATYSVSTQLNFSKQAITWVNGVGGAGGITLTLPNAANGPQKLFVIKKTDSAAGIVQVTPFSVSQTIDGQTSWSLLNQYQFILIGTDGNQWFIGSSN